jgi:hypothetical protein
MNSGAATTGVTVNVLTGASVDNATGIGIDADGMGWTVNNATGGLIVSMRRAPAC